MYENRSHCLGSYHEILSARYEEMSRELAKLVEQPDLELTRHERGLLFTVPPPACVCLEPGAVAGRSDAPAPLPSSSCGSCSSCSSDGGGGGCGSCGGSGGGAVVMVVAVSVVGPVAAAVVAAVRCWLIADAPTPCAARSAGVARAAVAAARSPSSSSWGSRLPPPGGEVRPTLPRVPAVLTPTTTQSLS
jgi:hypothetical protein